MKKAIEISVIIPVFNEEKSLEPLYDSLKSVLNKIKKPYEIIFVDDGSTDSSFDVLEKLQKKDNTLHIIKFRRNFGQTAAMDAGFNEAKGKIIISMDADLQNDPQDIPRLVNELNKGYDVVCGWRHNRRDSFLKTALSGFANWLRRLVTREYIHDSGCSLRAYKKYCLKDLDLYGEMHRYIPALLFWKGYKIGEVKIEHNARRYGKTKYNSIRIVKGFLDLIVIKFWMQYSTRPIHLFGVLGILFGFLGVIIGLYLTIIRLIYKESIANRPLLILSVLLIVLGVQFFVFGLLADILIKVYYKNGFDKNYSIEKKI